VISFQIRLYETSNIIEFVYQRGGGGINNGSASIGIMGALSTDFLSLTDAGASPGVSSILSTNNINSKPANSQVYRFTPPPPTILSFTPTSGCAGTSVTITGNNFTGATSVKFNGLTAAFTVVNNTTITATVPAGATAGPISVTSAGGTATSSTNFTVITSAPAVPSAPAPSTSPVTPNPICAGSSGTYTTAAVTGATQYIWSYSGTGATYTATTTVPSVNIAFSNTATSGTLTVQSSNGCFTSAASAGLAIVITPHVFTTATPLTQAICSGDSIQIIFDNTGSVSGVTYTWSIPAVAGVGGFLGKIGSPISADVSFGASGTVTTNGSGIQGYLTNSTGAAITDIITISSATGGCTGDVVTASITIYPATISVTKQPSNAGVCEGSDTSFTAAGTGSPSFTYQWYVSTDGGVSYNAITNITAPIGVYSNYTTATLYLSSPPASMSGYQYLCRIIGTCGAAYTNNLPGAALTVNPLPVVTVSPANANNCGALGVLLTGSSSIAGSTFAWSPAAGLSATTGASVTANPITPPVGITTYTVTGTTPGGCSGSAQATVTTALSGSYQVGAGKTFPTITKAVQAAVALGLCGPTTFLLTDATYSTSETFPITINAISGSSAVNTLTIKPYTGVTPTITGSINNDALFNILANNVIIDGANTVGGTTRNLTFTNSSTTWPTTIRIGSTGVVPVTNVIIKNAKVNTGDNTDIQSDATYGTRGSTDIMIIDGNSQTVNPVEGYFNNITIQNNLLSKAAVGVWAAATTNAGSGAGLNVTGNDLNVANANAIGNYGVYVRNVDGVTIQNNNIGNLKHRYHHWKLSFYGRCMVCIGYKKYHCYRQQYT